LTGHISGKLVKTIQ